MSLLVEGGYGSRRLLSERRKAAEPNQGPAADLHGTIHGCYGEETFEAYPAVSLG